MLTESEIRNRIDDLARHGSTEHAQAIFLREIATQLKRIADIMAANLKKEGK